MVITYCNHKQLAKFCSAYGEPMQTIHQEEWNRAYSKLDESVWSEDRLVAQPIEIGEVELADVVEAEHEHGESLQPHSPSAYRPLAAERFGDLGAE